MLISESLIFVHNPRTGGTSVRDYLKNAIPNDYYPAADPDLSRKEKVWIVHQGLAVAFKYAEKLGLDPTTIPCLVCIRNPYSLMLSGYQYLVQRWKEEAGDVEETFTEYLENTLQGKTDEKVEHLANAPFGPYSGYLLVNGEQPGNLTVARTESLATDVAKFLDQLTGVKPEYDFPHKNASRHIHFSAYFTRREEEIVYRLYKNTFESGLYQRYEGLDRDRVS